MYTTARILQTLIVECSLQTEEWSGSRGFWGYLEAALWLLSASVDGVGGCEGWSGPG